MTDRPSPVIRLATPADVLPLTALEARYSIGNLPPESRDNGFISIRHSAEWFTAASRDTASLDLAGDGRSHGGHVLLRSAPGKPASRLSRPGPDCGGGARPGDLYGVQRGDACGLRGRADGTADPHQ